MVSVYIKNDLSTHNPNNFRIKCQISIIDAGVMECKRISFNNNSHRNTEAKFDVFFLHLLIPFRLTPYIDNELGSRCTSIHVEFTCDQVDPSLATRIQSLRYKYTFFACNFSLLVIVELTNGTIFCECLQFICKLHLQECLLVATAFSASG